MCFLEKIKEDGLLDERINKAFDPKQNMLLGRKQGSSWEVLVEFNKMEKKYLV